jgi:hypothetical protein
VALPPLVMIVAGAALYLTGQGQDLSFSLLGAGQGTLALLALALFNWARGS